MLQTLRLSKPLIQRLLLGRKWKRCFEIFERDGGLMMTVLKQKQIRF
jgi:hypothetical protein